MKVFCFSGNNYKYSLSEYIAAQIKNRCSLNNKIVFYNYNYRELQIASCNGCEECFKGNVCPLDKIDNLEIVKNQLKESDIVIWITPVYAANVSGAMKDFIDRITYMLCEKVMENKIGIVASVTDRTGAEFSSLYLSNLMEQSGCKEIIIYNFIKSIVNVEKMIDEIVEFVLAIHSR